MIGFRRGGEMGLFGILLWRIIGRNSRFGQINSRLGRTKFPVCIATGIPLQRIDLACCSTGLVTDLSGKLKKFPARREKPGILLRFGHFLRERRR